MAPLVPRRARAGIAAAVLLAANAGGPATALAQKEPDVEHEGQAPEASLPVGGGDQAVDPEFDPGQWLPEEAEGEDGEAVDEGEAVEGDPLVDPVALEERRDNAAETPVAPTEREPQDGPADAPAPDPTAPAPDTPAVAPQVPAATSNGRFAEPSHAEADRRRSAAYGLAVVRADPARVPVSTDDPPVAAEPSAAVEPAQASRQAPTGGDRHLVQPGETLWSIARDLLGPDASTAAIAREVDRLWSLNADRIGTGDPDLIVAGQVLVLR